MLFRHQLGIAGWRSGAFAIRGSYWREIRLVLARHFELTALLINLAEQPGVLMARTDCAPRFSRSTVALGNRPASWRRTTSAPRTRSGRSSAPPAAPKSGCKDDVSSGDRGLAQVRNLMGSHVRPPRRWWCRRGRTLTIGDGLDPARSSCHEWRAAGTAAEGRRDVIAPAPVSESLTALATIVTVRPAGRASN